MFLEMLVGGMVVCGVWAMLRYWCRQAEAAKSQRRRAEEALHVSPRQGMDVVHPDDRERVVRASITKQWTGEYEEEYMW